MKRFKKIKKLVNKKTLLIVAAVIIVVGCSAGFWWYSGSKQDNSTPEQKVSKIVNDATTGGDVDKAQAKLKELADSEQDTDKKTVYLSGAADLYFNTNNYKNGLEVTKSIESLQPTALSAGNIAEAYSKLGDYKNAARYYGIAASRSEKPSRDTERAPYNDYMILQREAEGKIK